LNLNAKIARLQLSSLPESLYERMLCRDDVAALVEVGSIDIRDAGRLYFSDLRAALSEGSFGIEVDIASRRNGSAVKLTRSGAGNHSVRTASGQDLFLPELALLDSEIAVRQQAFATLVKKSKPCWPNCNFWRPLVAARPLSDTEFVQVIEELQNLAGNVLARIAQATAKDSFGVADLIPCERSYYESLVGPIPKGTTAGEYVTLELVPHLKCVFDADPIWGFRCLQASYISDCVDLAQVTTSVSSDALLSAIEASGIGASPFSILATYQIARQRLISDERFLTISNDALEMLIERASREEDVIVNDGLFVAFMTLTLNVISQHDPLSVTPPYWRRLAAFAHASSLLGVIDFRNWDTAHLIAWCNAQNTPGTVVTGLLDMVREPVWRADIQTTTSSYVAALMRALTWNPTTADQPSGLSADNETRVLALVPKFRLAFSIPDALSGGCRRQGAQTAQPIGEELLQGFMANEPAGTALLNSHQVWNALVYSARIFAFSPELLKKVRGLARSFQLAGGAIADEEYSILVCASELAAIQPDADLSEILATCVLNAAEHIATPEDAAKCFSILIVASAAAADWFGSLTWSAEKLVALAYLLPRGTCSEELAIWIESMQRFIPLNERRWGKAWAVARSAIR
jgi:hypothetical protein